MPKEDLGPHVRDTLIARHGSLPMAADRLGISYDRIKKAIQRNRFSAADLELLLPGRSTDSLFEQFTFELGRRQPGQEPTRDVAFDLFDKLETGFRAHQRGLRDTDFPAFVDDLYGKIGTEKWIKSMILFCHETSQPVEWRPEQLPLLKKLARAIHAGATIIYIMECDLENTVTPNPIAEDNVDRHFRRVVERLKTLCGDNHKGYIALLRVPRCAFCIPYQKPALFSHYATDGGAEETARHFALTTVEVPERIDGDGTIGTAVIPQTDVVAHAMRDYVFDLVSHLESGRLAPTGADPKKEGATDFHYQSYSAGSEAPHIEKLVRRLKKIAELR